MRVTDAMLAVPRLPLLMIAAAVLQPSVPLLVLLVGLAGWMETARVVRAEFISLRRRDFVEGARAAGAGHIARAGAAPAAERRAGGGRVADARRRPRHSARVGAQLLRRRRPAARGELGQHALSGADDAGTEPWLAVAPGLFILLTTLSVNALGDRLASRS